MKFKARAPRSIRGLFLVALLGAGCGRGSLALHAIPRPGAAAADFYDLPFPNDLRLREDGAFDLSSYPRLGGQLSEYATAMDGQIRGAGPGAAVIFRFDAPLDPSTLPGDPVNSIQPGASAFLIDITEGSPTYGRRAPVKVSFSADSGQFIGPNWMALQPVPGIPLRERTTYAAILTTDLRAADGGPVYRHPDLSALLSETAPGGDDATLQAAWQRYAPLRAYVASSFNLSAIVNATVMTTQDATSIMLRLRRAVYEKSDAPNATSLRYVRDHDGLCHIYHGAYLSPNFQQGDVPYLTQGGQIALTAMGDPLVSRTEDLRFALSVPNAPMPQTGWPVIVYAHGTGGDYESFVNEGIDLRAAAVETDGAVVARMAVISIDQVLHGPRDPTRSPVELTFFNLQNIRAARDNPKQGAADDFQLVRLIKRFHVPSAPVTGSEIRFDTNKIYFVGHSQGGLTGPLFLSAEPEVRAAVLSGAGAVLVLSLLNKTEPVNILSLVEGILHEPATPDHPFLNLLQAYFENSDPNNYGRLLFREPPPGSVPKSIFQTLGIVDHYAPVPNIEAFALSMGVQPVRPMLLPIDQLALSGLSWTDGPVKGNVAEGRATAVLRQYTQKPMSDGHFVLFDLWDARHDWSRFLAADISGGLAQLP